MVTDEAFLSKTNQLICIHDIKVNILIPKKD